MMKSAWALVLVACAGWACLAPVGAASAGDPAPRSNEDASLRRTSWPVLAHDSARSGSAPEAIKPPLQRRWYRNFADEGLMYGIEPVVSGGKVYIGTMRGVLHAMDDATGKDAWTYRVPFGIFHAAAVADGAVYVCGGDGKLHSVDAGTGEGKWTFDTGSGVALWNSPLPYKDKVYFGGRDGWVYAVNAANGQLAWKKPVGGPVVQSVAIDPATGRLYVGADDMRAYAFEVEGGKELWRSDRLEGFTFQGYYAVVVPEGGVVFTSRSYNRGWEGEAPKTLDDMLKKFFGVTRNDKNPEDKTEYPAFPSWRFTPELNRKLEAAVREKYKEPGLWDAQFAFIREQLDANPHRQTVFLLDAATGKRRATPPVIYCESNNGTSHPPVVTSAGKVVIPVAAALMQPNTFKDLGYLDPRTGDIKLVQPPGGRYANGSTVHIMADEQASVSAAGETIIVSRQDSVHAFDTHEGAPNSAEAWLANIHGPSTDEAKYLPLRLIRGEPLPVGSEYVMRGFGVYGGGSGVDSPGVVAGKTLYYISQHEGNSGCCLMAYEETSKQPPLKDPVKTAEMTDADRAAIVNSQWDFDLLGGRRAIQGVQVPGTPGSPAPATLPAAADEQALLKVLFEAPLAAGAVPEALKARLAAAVEELLSQDWAPLAFPEGKFPGEGYWALGDPSELFYALGLAWPNLSPDLQAKARQYARKHLGPDAPLAGVALDPQAGARRETYAFKVIAKMQHCRIREAGLARLYPLWLYAQASGDWEWVEKSWPEIRTTVAAPAKADWKTDGRNGQLSGLIAYCRIAAHMKDEASVKAGTDAALKAMRERLEYELTMTRGGVYYEGASGVLRSGPARWTFLTPEIGRLCRLGAPEVQKGLVGRYIDFLRPSWFLSWGILSCPGHENCTDMPIHAVSHFQAKAFLVDTPAGELAQYVDVPWCKADLYYIEKLSLAIRAVGQVEWKDTRP